MAHPAQPHVVVVGAGLAGLAAAEALLRGDGHGAAAIRVTLVDPAARVGGVLESMRNDGWLVERSADSFLAARPEAVALAERLGLSDEFIGVDPAVRRALVFSGGRTHAVPAGFRLLAPSRIGSVLTTPLLSPAGRLRVLAERFVPARSAAVEDESLESFAVRRLGREAFDRLVQPLAAGIWTADPARLSMAAACGDFYAMELRDGSLWAGEGRRGRGAGAGGTAAGARYGQFLTLASGMETLPLRLARRLDELGAARLHAAATAVAPRPGGGWEVRLAPGTAGAAAAVPATLAAAAVILAAPAGAAAGAVRGCDAELAGELAAIEYAGSAIVSLGFRRDDVAHPLDAAGMVVPRVAGRRLLAVSFSSRKFPGRAPPGHVLLRSFVGGALDPAAMDLGDEPLVRLVRGELRAMLGVEGEPRLVQVDRWRGAMPQYVVGHARRVARIDRLVARHRGLALAGAAYEGVGIPQVIGSGEAAAKRVVAALAAAPPG
jgi:protoporphyrinogen/coproporphyrinogen III oxidase